jgi:hypothetical protein
VGSFSTSSRRRGAERCAAAKWARCTSKVGVRIPVSKRGFARRVEKASRLGGVVQRACIAGVSCGRGDPRDKVHIEFKWRRKEVGERCGVSAGNGRMKGT